MSVENLLCGRRSGMTVGHRYGPLVQQWRVYVDCKGYENTLTACQTYWWMNSTSIVYIRKTNTRNVFISCNNSGV